MSQVNTEQMGLTRTQQMENDGVPGSSLLAAISDARSLCVLPKDPITAEVLISVLQASTSLDVMMGYFSSGSFPEIAHSLATFLKNTDAPMRMVVSPFLTSGDFEALTKDDEELTRLATRIFIDVAPDEDKLVRHTLECLAWPIIQGVGDHEKVKFLNTRRPNTKWVVPERLIGDRADNLWGAVAERIH